MADGTVYATQSQASGTQTFATQYQDVVDPSTGKQVTIKLLANGSPDTSDPATASYVQNQALVNQGTSANGDLGGGTGGGSGAPPTSQGSAGGSSGGNPLDPATALKNLQAFDPNAPLPDQFKIDPGTVTPGQATPGVAATAPVITAPGAVSAPSLDFNTGLTAPQITATPTAGTVPVVSAPQLGPAPTVSAGSVGGGSVSAQNIDPSAATATPVADVSAQGVGRDAETQGLDYLKGVAEGTTTTAADKLLQKGVDENVGAAYGLAASLQGRNPGQALRQGLTSARTAVAKSSADVAAQKAQEQQTAMQQYATLGTSIAGQDLQAAMSNQSKDLQLSVTQMQAKIDVLKANQASQLSAGEATLASQTQAQIATLQSQTNVAIAQLQTSTARDIANQTAQLDASKANAANTIAVNIATLQAQVQVEEANLQAATSTQNTQAQIDAQKAITQYQGQLDLLKQQQDQLYDAAKTNAANATQTNITNANNATTVATSNAANTTQASIAQQQLAEKAKADENTMDAQLAQLGLSSLVAQLNAAIENAKTDQQRQAAEDSFWASIIGTGAKAGTAIAAL